jgi:hypothetical protein
MDPRELDLERDASPADGILGWRIPFGAGTWRGRSLRWEGWVMAAVTRDAS